MTVAFVIDERGPIEAQKALGKLPTDGSMVVTIQKVTRSLSQNAVQWPILNAFSNQLKWPVNGEMVKLEPEEWKDILTVAYKQETVRLAPGLNGGMVMLGKKTRKFKAAEWSEWMEFLNSVVSDRGIKVPMSKSQCEALGYG